MQLLRPFTRAALRLTLGIGLLAATACGSDPGPSGLASDRLGDTLTADEGGVLCDYEVELTSACDGGTFEPSLFCAGGAQFIDPQGCGYTVGDVEQCFAERWADPCNPQATASCSYIDDCTCSAEGSCQG